MKPARCPVCQSDQLTDLLLIFRGGLFLSFLRFAELHAAACLQCGAVTRYLDDATVKVLRTQVARRTKAKLTDDEL